MTAKIAVALVVCAACSGVARTPATYRDDTRKLLETRSASLEQCYNQALAADAQVAGTVTVRFVVEKKTGLVSSATIDTSTSKAPEPLVVCLLEAVKGLKLDPPDRNEGQASFTYVFSPSPAAT